MKADFIKNCKYELYIGLTDMDINKSRINYEEFMGYLEEYCTEHKIAFSVNRINGGYNHKTGYLIEDSLVITLLGDDSARFLNAIEDIKKLINTDKILLTREYVDVTFV